MNLPTSPACQHVPQARIVIRSTRPEVGLVEVQLVEEHLAAVERDAAEQGLARRRRLLEDFLQHEVLVAGPSRP